MRLPAVGWAIATYSFLTTICIVRVEALMICLSDPAPRPHLSPPPPPPLLSPGLAQKIAGMANPSDPCARRMNIRVLAVSAAESVQVIPGTAITKAFPNSRYQRSI